MKILKAMVGVSVFGVFAVTHAIENSKLDDLKAKIQSLKPQAVMAVKETAENLESKVESSKEVAFNPKLLTLDDAIDFAVHHNLSFRNSQTGMEVAARSVHSSRAALYEPELRFSHSRSSSYSPANPVFGIPGYSSSQDGSSVAYNKTLKNSGKLSVSYDLNDSNVAGRTQQVTSGLQASYSQALFAKDASFVSSKGALDSLEIERQKSIASYLESYQSLVYNVVNAYLETVKNYRQIEVSKSVLNYRRELLELTRVKYRLGVATKLDVLRVEVQVADEEQSLLMTRNTYENSLDSLLNLLNYDKNHAGDVELDYSADFSLKDYDVQAYLDKAYDNRFDLIRSRLSLAQEEVTLDVREKNVENHIMMEASLTKKSTDDSFPESHDYDNRDWRLGFSYTLPLGNGEKREQLMIQRARVENQKRVVEELEDSVHLEVKNAIRSLKTNQKRLQVMQKNLERAKENLKLARLSYEKGIKSSIDVLDAQDDLLEVNKGYVDAILDLRIAEYGLKKICGTINIPRDILEAASEWGYNQ